MRSGKLVGRLSLWDIGSTEKPWSFTTIILMVYPGVPCTNSTRTFCMNAQGLCTFLSPFYFAEISFTFTNHLILSSHALLFFCHRMKLTIYTAEKWIGYKTSSWRTYTALGFLELLLLLFCYRKMLLMILNVKRGVCFFSTS